MVTRTLVDGAAESETGVGRLSFDFIGDGPTLDFTGMYKDYCMF